MKSLVWFEVSDSCYTINFGSSPEPLTCSHVLFFLWVMEILQLGSAGPPSLTAGVSEDAAAGLLKALDLSLGGSKVGDGACFPSPIPPALALLFCPGKDRASSSECMSPGPPLQTCFGEGWGKLT